MSKGQLQPLMRRLREVAGADSPPDEVLLGRFVRSRDGEAFAALVRRHGPLVRGVCRQVLCHSQDAEDAFQATFLVLARKAASLSRPERLGPWLRGVAHRTAIRARKQSALRRQREESASPAPQVESRVDAGCDLRGVLDEEIARLPERQRAAVVLCYLEGHTNAEAAARLGCSRGTVATLLARARERLGRRLRGRGLAEDACLAGQVTLALEQAGRAASLARGFGPRAAEAAAIAKGVLFDMWTSRLSVIGLALLVGLALGGAGLAAHQASAGAGEEDPPAARQAAAPAAEEEAGPKTFRTANFEVTAPTQAVARKVAAWAEFHRKQQASTWLGKELPAWDVPCPIDLSVGDGGPSGATTFVFDKGKVISREMRLEGHLDQILTRNLPHEVAHAVLADHFGRPVPRWASEGAASLAEDRAGRDHYEALARKILQAGRHIPLSRLIGQMDYPRDVQALYAEGYSLTSFLLGKSSRGTFLNFVADGTGGDWDAAVKKHYGYGGVDELEEAWLKSLKLPARPADERKPVERGRATEVSQGVPKAEAKTSYVVEPPDVLRVEASGLTKKAGRTMSGEYLVRPDGTVGLGSSGSVFVSGMTLEQARAAIGERLAPHAKKGKPEVRLELASSNSKFFYVIGRGKGDEQVRRFPAAGGETVAASVLRVEGLSATAAKGRVWVVRASGKVLEVDWQAITQKGEPATDYELQSGDRVYVRAKATR